MPNNALRTRWVENSGQNNTAIKLTNANQHLEIMVDTSYPIVKIRGVINLQIQVGTGTAANAIYDRALAMLGRVSLYSWIGGTKTPLISSVPLRRYVHFIDAFCPFSSGQIEYRQQEPQVNTLDTGADTLTASTNFNVAVSFDFIFNQRETGFGVDEADAFTYNRTGSVGDLQLVFDTNWQTALAVDNAFQGATTAYTLANYLGGTNPSQPDLSIFLEILDTQTPPDWVGKYLPFVSYIQTSLVANQGPTPLLVPNWERSGAWRCIAIDQESWNTASGVQTLLNGTPSTILRDFYLMNNSDIIFKENLFSQSIRQGLTAGNTFRPVILDFADSAKSFAALPTYEALIPLGKYINFRYENVQNNPATTNVYLNQIVYRYQKVR